MTQGQLDVIFGLPESSSLALHVEIWVRLLAFSFWEALPAIPALPSQLCHPFGMADVRADDAEDVSSDNEKDDAENKCAFCKQEFGQPDEDCMTVCMELVAVAVSGVRAAML